MNPEIQRTVAQLGSVSVAAQRLTLAVYATRRAGWGAPLDVFFGHVAPTVAAALTTLDAVATEFQLTEQHQVAMLLRYLDVGGPAGVVDYLQEFGREQREIRKQAELAAFANTVAYGTAADEQALVAELEQPLPPPPSVALAPQANAAEAAAALQRAASSGYVPPVLHAPPAPPAAAPTPPPVYAPIPAPLPQPPQPAPQPALVAPTQPIVHAPVPASWQAPAAVTAPAAAPAEITPLPAGTRVTYQLGPHALLATVVRPGANHAEIRTDQGHVYESVSWQYLVPSTAPLVVAATAAPAVASQITALTTGSIPAEVAVGTVLCCVTCTEIAEPGTGQACQLILDLVVGPQHDCRASLRLESPQHQVLAAAMYDMAALFTPQALRMHYHDRVLGIDLTIPAAAAAVVPTRKRGTKAKAPAGPLPNQTELPLDTTAALPTEPV